MIEEDEQIVNYIEDIDATFSSINRRLKEILMKVYEIKKVNTKVIQDFEPLMKMFNINKTENIFVEDLNFPQIENSSLILKTSSPKNPFVDGTSSELINKTMLNTTVESVKVSSSLVEDCKYSEANLIYEDSSSTELREFNIELIPELFRNEEHLMNVYNFIKSRKSVQFEELIETFGDVDSEKVVIYLDLLKNKKFIKRKNNLFYVEKEMSF
jgi:hypothetical protein